MPLPYRNTTSYGGYKFSQLVETMDIDITPVQDEAKRTVIYNKYIIKLRDKILAGQTGSTGLSTYSVQARAVQARDLLTKQGGKFVYTDRGVGNIFINTGAIRDIAYGPKVLGLNMKPSPGSLAVTLEWTVEIWLPECPAAKYGFALMAYNYRSRYAIGRFGETTRSITGYIEIPANRGGGQMDRTLSDSVDNYREEVAPAVPYGFRRASQDYSVNNAKTRLDFTITDEEMVGTVPPPGIVDAKASHSISSAQAGLVNWVATIDARYWVGRPYPKGLALEAFLALVADRVGFTATYLRLPVSTFVALALRFAEPEIYAAASDPTAVFSLTYTFATSLRDIFAGSGLWRPIRFSDWDAWAATMPDVLGPRGVAQLKLKASDDKITDLCDPSIKIPSPGGQDDDVGTRILRAGGGLCPLPITSWLKYDVHIETEGDDGTIETALIPKTPLKQVPRGTTLVSGFPNQADDNTFFNPNGIDTGPGWLSDFTGTPSQKSGSLQPTFQQRSAPIVYIYLCGSALRVCYPINPPSLVAVDNMVPKVANRTDRGEGFKQGIVSNVGHSIYGAKWRIRYAVPSGYLQKMPIPSNPLKDLDRTGF